MTVDILVQQTHANGTPANRVCSLLPKPGYTARRGNWLGATTPLLPQFDKTLAFYVREGFSVTGGRKLKTLR